MDISIKPLAILAVALLPLIAACTPDTPETELSWDVNDRPAAYHENHATTRYDAPTRYDVPRAAPTSRVEAHTYVYQGDNEPAYTVPDTVAPKPRPAYQSASTSASTYSYGARENALAYSTPATYSGNGAFAWPLSGRVIAQFGTTANGERNDGINIAAPMDTPIRAAASGTVTYSGNELKNYGNLLLIKHEGGYVTAYAHADRLLVGRGDFVTKGQVIGYTGSTGDVSSPQLHFEIRHDTTPVDPRNLLMARNS